jgi:hypothetical protein
MGDCARALSPDLRASAQVCLSRLNSVHSNPHDTLVFQYRATLDETKMQQATEQIDTLALETSNPSEQHQLQLMDLSPEVLMTIHDYLPPRDLVSIGQLNSGLHAIARRRLTILANPIDDAYWPKLHQLVSDEDEGYNRLARTERLTWDTTLMRIPDTIFNLKMLHVMYTPGDEGLDVEFVRVLDRFQSTLRILVVSYKNTSALLPHRFYLSDVRELPADRSLNLETLVIRANIPYAKSLYSATKQTLKHLITCGPFDDEEQCPNLRFLCRVMKPQSGEHAWVWFWPRVAISFWPKMVLSMRIETPDVSKHNRILDRLPTDKLLDLVNKLDNLWYDERTAISILVDFLKKHKSLVCSPALIETCDMYVQCRWECYTQRAFPCDVSYTDNMNFPWESYSAIIFGNTGGLFPFQLAMVINKRRQTPNIMRRWLLNK